MSGQWVHATADHSTVDLVIIGTGPAGATMARRLAESRPRTSILMVDLGPALSHPPGTHITKLPLEEHGALLAGSQGPDRGEHREPPGLYSAPAGRGLATASAPPGLYRPFTAADGVPAAASTSMVGGMGAYWGGITPRPAGSERIPFLKEEVWDELIGQAEDLLEVSHDVMAGQVIGPRVRERLGGVFQPVLPAGRRVEVEALAARQTRDGHFTLTGTADILAPVRSRLAAGGGSLELRPDTLCKRVRVQGNRVSGVLLEHRPSGESYEVRARAVVVAADVYRTPQLLWASGIRPEALGRHLMDHPLCNATVELDPQLTEPAAGSGPADRSVSCVPFADPEHPHHGVVLQGLVNLVPGSWVRAAGRGGVPVTVAGLTWLARTAPRSANRVLFSETETDWCGMPQMSAEFSLTEQEERERGAALEHLKRAAAALGTYIPGREPSMRALGGSLHATGTARTGPADDGTSVCDPHSRVWGFDNLFLAGNALIPVATTVNPTLTSLALAIHGARELAGVLG